MITFLRGQLVTADPAVVTIEVHGVGYEVLIPLSSYDRLPAVGSEVHLLTHLTVREDAHLLYGFMSGGERDLFRLLINTVSGIGPKTALNVLSGMNVATLRGAVATSDVKSLSQISGVGRKTAERIVMELKDKLGSAAAGDVPVGVRTAAPGGQTAADAIAALVTLGLKPVDAQEAVRAAQLLLGTGASVDALVRACFKKGA